jgi:UDP-hydrolysing UDP-N-acetyl-D-glucosamine 2-epimerase
MSIDLRRRYLAFSGIRSDYDLLSGIYQGLNGLGAGQFGLIVSGAHLSPTYGKTVDLIEVDGLPIIARIESLLDADSIETRLKSASILLQGCLHTVTQFKPDAILFAGDREDALVGALVGGFLKIPTLHFFGGDHAEDGNIDNSLRHAVSKLASVHFVTHETHKQRLMAIGEEASRIWVIGNPALDRFVSTPLVDRASVMRSMGCPGWDRYCVVIFHPILGHEATAAEGMRNIIDSLKQLDIRAFVSLPNVDTGNREIMAELSRHADDENIHVYSNVERSLFINLLRHADVLIGNSSAGLLEAPIVPLAVVNVGPRQRGRLAADNVIFCDIDKQSVIDAVTRAKSAEFQAKLSGITSPYGAGRTVQLALDLIQSLDLASLLYKRADPLKP